MAINRAGEMGDYEARSDRFFKKRDYWYYSTREGVDIGPFDSLSKAEVGVHDFIDFISHAEPKVIARLQQYRHAA